MAHVLLQQNDHDGLVKQNLLPHGPVGHGRGQLGSERPERHSPRKPKCTVHQIATARELTVHRIKKPAPFRDAVCELCEETVSMALCVPISSLRARTRQTQDVALARQIAMYLAHTIFSLPLTEVGHQFGRDRTTVSHACALVEDRRDDEVFDTTISQLESLLNHTLSAVNCLCDELAPGSDDGVMAGG